MPVISRAERKIGVNATPQPYSTGDGYSAPGRGLAALGAAIGRLGEQADEQEMFKAKMAVSEYEFNKAKEEDERAFNFVPGRDGAASDYDRDYITQRTESDQKFLSQFSGKARQAAELHLQSSRQSSALRAQNHRQNLVVQETVGLVQAQTARAATTVDGSFDSVFPALQAVDEAVNEAPGLTPRQRALLREHAAEAVLDAWEQKAPWQEKEKRLQEMRGSVGKWLKGFEGKDGAPAGDGPLDKTYVDQIKKFEGYAPRATWDYKQHSVGYGTRARHAGEAIDRAEADRRLNEELGKAAEIVDKFAPGLDAGTRAALTSLTFNAGSSWTTGRLGQQIKAGDLEGAKQTFLAYNKAGGETLPGLASRRRQEAQWFGRSAGPALAKAEGAPLTGTPPDETGGDNGEAAFISARDRLKLPDSATMGDHVIKRFLPRVDRLEKQVQAGRLQEEAIATVEGWRSGRVKFNANDSEGRKLYDQVYALYGLGKRLATMTPKDFMPSPGSSALPPGMAVLGQITLDAAQANYMAKDAYEGVKGLFDSTDPKLKQIGYDTVLNLYDKNPNIFDTHGGDSEMLKEAEHYRRLRRTMDADKAVARLIEEKQPDFKLRKAATKDETDKLMKPYKDGATVHSQIAKDMDEAGWSQWFVTGYGALGGRPQTDIERQQRAAMIADYTDSLRDELERTGDIDKAKAGAISRFKHRYGVSNLFGRETVMAFPPERFYQANLTDKDGPFAYIEREVREQVGIYNTAADPNSIRLRVLPNRYWHEGKPAYEVVVTRKDNGLEEVVPLRYVPGDPNAGAKFKEEDAKARGKVPAADGPTLPVPPAGNRYTQQPPPAQPEATPSESYPGAVEGGGIGKAIGGSDVIERGKARIEDAGRVISKESRKHMNDVLDESAKARRPQLNPKPLGR